MSVVGRRPPTRFDGSSRSELDDVFKTERSSVAYSDAYVNSRFRHFVRRYIANHLHEKGFDDLAKRHDVAQDTEDGSERMLHHLAGSLAEERERQFEDILNRLDLTDDNLSDTYRVIVREMFIDGVNWGRILAFLVFSGALAVHCARENMASRVGDVIAWTEDDVEKTVSRWVARQGGWKAFVDHFDAGSWTIESPQTILAGILILLVGGMYLLQKLF